MNVITVDINTTAASSLSNSAIPTNVTKMSNPETPSNMKSKLNPAVAAFTPSHSSSKDSANSGGAQTSSPTKEESKPSVTATDLKEEGFIPPHLRRVHNISTQGEPVTTGEQFLIEDKIKSQDSIATSTENESSKGTKAPRPSSIYPPLPYPLPPHLRRPNQPAKSDNVLPPQVQQSDKGKMKEDAVHGAGLFPRHMMPTGMKDNVQAATTPDTFVKPDPSLQDWLDTQENAQPNNAFSKDLNATIKDTLIDIDPDSPEKGFKKATVLPPGFTPFTANDDAPAKTQTATPIKTNIGTSPATVFDNLTTGNPTVQDGEAATEPKAYTISTATEKERNAAFLAQYTNSLDSIYAKYSRDYSRNGSSEDKTDEMDPFQTKPV